MENTSLPTVEISTTGKNIFMMVVHLIIFLFGVPGNCLILRVYWTKSRKTSTHVLIMALAWADLSVCLLRVRMIAENALLLAGDEETCIPRGLNIIWALSTTSVAVSVLVTAVIAADRYDCVCRSHNRFFTTRRAKRAVWASLLFSLVLYIPTFIAKSTGNSNTVLDMLILAFQAFCFMTALSMIISCYGLVHMTIRKHVNKARQDANMDTREVSPAERDVRFVSGKGSSRPKREPTDNDRALATKEVRAARLQRKTTRMLFVTSVVFLLTWLPHWTFVFMEFADNGGAEINPTLLSIIETSSVTLFINNAVNPLIYSLTNRRFREDCRKVFRKMKLC